MDRQQPSSSSLSSPAVSHSPSLPKDSDPERPLTRREGFWAIAAIAAAVILVEISVTRVLSFRLFYHFVYMVISTALLGLSAGASIVACRSAQGRPVGRSLMAASAMSFALLAPVTLFFLTVGTPPPNTIHGKISEINVLLLLPVAYVLLTSLFLAAGLIVAALFAEFRRDVSRLYFFDLLGAAIAGVAAVGIMKFCTPVRCFLAGGAISALVGLWLTRSRETRRWAMGIATVASLLLLIGPVVFDPSQNLFKRMERSNAWKWDHQARVDFWPGNFVIDADASTRQAPLFDGPTGAEMPSLYTFYEFPYEALQLKQARVAIIGSGGGGDIYNGLRHDSQEIVAIELNQSIFRWMMSQEGSVYRRPTVKPMEGEGRHTLRGLEQKFDLIQLSLIDTYTASAQGAYALTENYLYTVEAFEEYLDHLEPGGALYISRWLFDTPRETLRLCALGHEALRRQGIVDTRSHMVVIAEDHKLRADRRRGGFLLSRTPLDEAKVQQIVSQAAARDYQVLYAPGKPDNNPFHDFMNAADKPAFYASYPYRVDPVTDDRPFFFQHSRMFDMVSGLSTGGTGFSQIVLVVTLILAVILSVAIVLQPVRRLKIGASAAERRRIGLYFSCLGLGFMLIEIPMIQRFTLYLGHPTHALVTVLSCLLVSAAVGSLIAGRIPLGRPATMALAAVAVTVLVWQAAAPGITAATIGASMMMRLAVCLALVAPLGVGLGLPLTLGVRSIANEEAVVAWAWACNGAASVVAACLAMVLLVYSGFVATVVTGSLCYFVAAAVLGRLGRCEATSTQEVQLAKPGDKQSPPAEAETLSGAV